MKFFLITTLTLITCSSFSQVDLSWGLSKKSGDTIILDVWYDTQVDVKIFNFEIKGIGADVALIGWEEGQADQSGFSVIADSANNKMRVLNFVSATLPHGSAKLFGIKFLNPNQVTSVCIENPYFSSGGGQDYTTTLPSCYDISNIPDGIEDPLAKSFEIYPNPISQGVDLKINLKHLPAAQLNIYNTTGGLVRRHEFVRTGWTNLSLKDIHNGVYLIEITSDTFRYIKKLLIQ